MSLHRITFDALLRGRACQNVIHLNNPDGVLTAAQIKDEIVANWITILKPKVTSAYTWTILTVKRIDQPAAPPAETFPLAIVGTGSTFHQPQICCVKLKFVTGLSGPRHRGRFYQSGSSTGDWNSDDTLTTAAVTSWSGIATSIANRFKSAGTGPLSLQIVHRGPEPDVPTPVLNIVVDPKMACMRSRNVGVGI